MLQLSCFFLGQTKWTKKWKTNGWKSSNGSEVINREELELLDAEEAGIKVNYVRLIYFLP